MIEQVALAISIWLGGCQIHWQALDGEWKYGSVVKCVHAREWAAQADRIYVPLKHFVIPVAAGLCKVVWRDAGSGKRYESKAMDCIDARKRRDQMERDKPNLEVWVEEVKGRKK